MSTAKMLYNMGKGLRTIIGHEQRSGKGAAKKDQGLAIELNLFFNMCDFSPPHPTAPISSPAGIPTPTHSNHSS